MDDIVECTRFFYKKRRPLRGAPHRQDFVQAEDFVPAEDFSATPLRGGLRPGGEVQPQSGWRTLHLTAFFIKKDKVQPLCGWMT
jgi:hypothetical protein